MGRGIELSVALGIALSSCQCLVPVDEVRPDSGRPSFDGGRADAGRLDAGSFDAGRADAGTSVPQPEKCDGLDNDLDGLVDVLADGGALTRSCPLTQGICAGARSVCINGSFAQCDYGPNYLLADERCDGLDNDCDGLVDVLAGGGPITRACPLTLGVCAAARSVCVNGGFAQCDYGSTYQLAGERCDGLDNDCDGLVDVLAGGSPVTRACPLTLGVCATARSVCINGGFPQCNYGPDYLLAENRCDGLDNDCDGLVDRLAGGGPITGACPLTLGVCATARSVCVNGGFASCNYGPQYDLTEHRCDGVDNDCDGRVDKSWPRVLLGIDAGRVLPRDSHLMMGDVRHAQVITRDGGLLMNLPGDVLSLNDDLGVEASTRFPLHNHFSVLAWNGASWTRAILTYGPIGCMAVEELPSDAGVLVSGDVLPRVLAQACWQELSSGPLFIAEPGPTGWRTLAIDRPFRPSLPGVYHAWAVLSFDGGTAQGITNVASLGAPPSPANGLELIDGRFLDIHSGSTRTLVWEVQVPGGAITPVVDTTWSLCYPSRRSPLEFACGAVPDLYWGLFDPRPTDWLALDGGIVIQGLGAVHPVWSGTGDLGTTQSEDAGAAAPINWVFVSDAGRTTVESIAGLSVGRRTFRLNERLVLLTWLPLSTASDPSGCPACPIDGLNAEYVCLPP